MYEDDYMYNDDYLDTADMWRIEQDAREVNRLMDGYYCESYTENEYENE